MSMHFQYLHSPVHNCLKFSAVFGTILENSWNFMRPAGVPPIDTSKNTIGLSPIKVLSIECVSEVEVNFKGEHSTQQIEDCRGSGDA